jgi:hypothetical protein
VLVGVLSAIVCSVAFASPASAAWNAPEQVASSRVWEYSRPLVALDGAGAGVLVWHREERLNETLSGVEASTRPGAGWSAPVVLGPSRPSQAAYFPEVAIDAHGVATAVWGGISEVQAAASRATGKGFGRAKGLPGKVSAAAPQVAVDPGGDATVVYPRSATGLWVIARRSAGSWRALPAIAGTSRSGISEPRVARDSRGEAILAWVRGYRSGGAGLQVQTVVLGANNKPERPSQTLFSAKNREIGELDLAANSRGDAVLVWHQKTKGGPVVIEAATRRAGARFGRPVTVSREQSAAELSVALDAHGFAALVFTRIISTQPGAPEEAGNGYPAYTQTAAVEVSTRVGGRGWSKPSKLAPNAKGSTFEPQVACRPSGGTLEAVWTNARFRSSEVATYTGNIETSMASPSGSWQTPVVISPPNSFAPALAVSANGNAIAAWVGAPESSKTESIETADYEPG